MRNVVFTALPLLASVSAFAAPCPARTVWPTPDFKSRADAVKAAKAEPIKALEDYAFTLEGKDSERLGRRTDAMIILKGGEIVYERYARGWDREKRHISWSVAKSVSSALIGRAVMEKALDVEKSVCDYLPEVPESACKIKVKHLLEFSSGLDWQEEYEDQTYQVSSVIAMLFGVGHKDQLRFIASHKFYAEPGTKWRYSTGEAQFLSAVAKAATVQKTGSPFARKLLFDRLGMKSAMLEEDAKGTPLGGSMVFANARDYARFGYLYLNDGCWEGTRLLPEDWVKQSTTASKVFLESTGPDQRTPNGWQFWVNQPNSAGARPWKDAPPDAYSAIGHWGQYVAVVPSADVVIVRLGDDRKGRVDLNVLIPLALEVAK